MAEQISARPMDPHLGGFLIWRIGDQIERVARCDILQMHVPIGKSDSMNRGTEVRGSTIRERRSKPAHCRSIV